MLVLIDVDSFSFLITNLSGKVGIYSIWKVATLFSAVSGDLGRFAALDYSDCSRVPVNDNMLGVNIFPVQHTGRCIKNGQVQ
jgi:hypothetical protein